MNTNAMVIINYLAQNDNNTKYLEQEQCKILGFVQPKYAFLSNTFFGALSIQEIAKQSHLN